MAPSARLAHPTAGRDRPATRPPLGPSSHRCHPEQRQTGADTAERRQELVDAARQLAAALKQARTERVIAAARDRGGHGHLHQILGPAPRTRGGLAAWCALADRIETERDNP